MKLNKNIKIFLNYFLGPVLFVWLSLSIYRQIKAQPDLELSWQRIKDTLNSTAIWKPITVVLLMFMNWSVETFKWKLAVRPVQTISFFTALKAVLSGVSFSVTTPNRTGEYLGRILYMDEGNRLRTISLTILCSISQLIITVLAGFIGLVCLRGRIIRSDIFQGWSMIWVQVFLYGTLVFLFILTLFYFRLSLFAKWLDRLPKSEKYSYLIRELEAIDATLLLKLLSLSAIRFFVFMLQYYLLFAFFDVGLDWWQCFWSVSLTFLILAAIPSFALIDLGIRGEVSLKVVSLFSANAIGIGFTTATVWFVNLIIPALTGSLLILGIKIFKKKK
ncbi:MAG: hypothetical protein GC171_09540 [Terrimonas sp.]|nr:hypothetical protein [Terrimonas sp.]